MITITYHVLDDKDRSLCGSYSGYCYTLEQFKSIDHNRYNICARCYKRAIKIFKASVPKEYTKYCESLPCGKWTQAQIEGLWNAAIEAAASVAENQSDFSANAILELKI